MTFAGGEKYVGEWKDDKPHGHLTVTAPDGEVVKGIWRDGKLLKFLE